MSYFDHRIQNKHGVVSRGIPLDNNILYHTLKEFEMVNNKKTRPMVKKK